MVKLKLKNKSRDEPLILRRGGVTYSITSSEEVDMPLAYAVYVMGDAISYRFDASDKSDLLAATNDLERIILKLEGAPSLDAVVTKHFPKKLSSVKSKPKPKPEVKEEPVVEKKEPEVKEEKPAPKKRGRPPKKKTEDASPKPKVKKTKKTTTKEE
tara:strand:- start:328 stop:795 length:468 start_codon:yes stop_codon:yes gene_type:complete